MLAACVQTDSKNEKRARKRYLGVSTLVPLKRKSAIKRDLAVHFLTCVGGVCAKKNKKKKFKKAKNLTLRVRGALRAVRRTACR